MSAAAAFGEWVRSGNTRFLLLLTLCSAVAAALLLPRQTPFPYRYAIGHPWSHRTLRAPFDFEVLYPEQQVQAEVQRVRDEHGPYFRLSTDIAKQQKRKFAQLLEEQARISRHDTQFDDLNHNLAAYARFGQAMLDHVFAEGLADPQEEVLAQTPGGFVYVTAGKEERRVALGDLWTVTTAHNFLTDTLPYTALRQPELLLPILEKVLVPNLLYSDSLTLASQRHKLAAVRSTGVSVQKSEPVVQRGEIVTPDTAQKLDSLARRYDAPRGPEVLLGYALLALLAFGGFFYGFEDQQPTTKNQQLFWAAIALALIAAISAGSKIGLAVPLLLPLYALPFLLAARPQAQVSGSSAAEVSEITPSFSDASPPVAVKHDTAQRDLHTPLPVAPFFWEKRPAWPSVGLALWGIVVLLSTAALDWGAGWSLIQAAGLAGVLFFQPTSGSWRARGLAALLTALLQIAAWAGVGWAGRLPDSVWTADVLLFLLVSAGLWLGVYPLRRAMRPNFL